MHIALLSAGRYLPAVAFLLLVGAGPAVAYHGKVTTLHDFCHEENCTDGINPNASLVMDGLGNLYGATPQGGDTNSGVVFELSPNPGHPTWKYKRLYSFCDNFCSDSFSGASRLIIDADGNLYGTRQIGGSANAGYVYELVHNANRTHWTLKIIHEFCSFAECADGMMPSSGLTYLGASAGAPYDGVSPLYGRTPYGGNTLDNQGIPGYGVAYELVRTGNKWKESVLHTFCSQGGSQCTDGGTSYRAGLLVDGSGNLYGTTAGGGANSGGLVFELNPGDAGAEWPQTILYNFCAQENCADGSGPDSDLIMDAGGSLYGTSNGGTHQLGTIFKIAPNGANSVETVLYNFCSKAGCADGGGPAGGVTMDAKGSLFGLTTYGGRVDSGVLYRLKGSTFNTLHRFCTAAYCRDGFTPVGDVVLDAAGNPIFEAQQGGRGSKGGVFQFTPGSE